MNSILTDVRPISQIANEGRHVGVSFSEHDLLMLITDIICFSGVNEVSRMSVFDDRMI